MDDDDVVHFLLVDAEEGPTLTAVPQPLVAVPMAVLLINVALHVRLGWPEFAGDPDGQAYEFFGSYDSPAPMTYVALVKPSEFASWLVAGLGYGCQMRAENLKKLGPRARINAELPSAT
mgnify:CR=1 FL=1